MSRKDAEKRYKNLKENVKSFEDHIDEIPRWRYVQNKECVCGLWKNFVDEKISDALFAPHPRLSFTQDEFVSAIKMDQQKDFEYNKYKYKIYPTKDDIWDYLRNTFKGGTQWKCGS